MTGRVTDASTGRGVAGAQVFIPETAVGGLTDAQGAYTLTGVPAGESVVRVRILGYRATETTPGEMEDMTGCSLCFPISEAEHESNPNVPAAG